MPGSQCSGMSLDKAPRAPLAATRPRTVGSKCMSPVGWLPVVAELCALDPPVWVFGGIAEEALLEGAVTREHGDIDLLVNRNALSIHLHVFEAIGYPPPQVYFEVVSGSPLVLGAERDGMPMEVGVYDQMESGIASFLLPTVDGLTRFILPGDTLHYPDTRINGNSCSHRFHLLPCITSVRPSSSQEYSALPGTKMWLSRRDSGTRSYRRRPRTNFVSAPSPHDTSEPRPDGPAFSQVARSSAPGGFAQGLASSAWEPSREAAVPTFGSIG